LKFVVLTTLILLGCLLVGCTSGEPVVIVITATFAPTSEAGVLPETAATPLSGSEVTTDNQNIDSGQTTGQNQDVSTYTVQPGDTLTGIADAHDTTLATLMDLNQITDPDVISVGQVIELPPAPGQVTSDLKLLSDVQLIRAPGSDQFDVAAFIVSQPGYIRVASDTVPTNQANGFPVNEVLKAADIVTRVSTEFSIDPRVLLALLEYRAGWLSNPSPQPELLNFPMISEAAAGTIDRKGLYKQLAWTANELNRGYYGWKYDGWRILEFDQGQRLLYASNLNPATVGLQHMLHLANTFDRWKYDVSSAGFYQIYTRYFGDPFTSDTNTLAGLTTQPDLTLPFISGETWFFTGGAHGGWGTGSAWAAIDFAPPDDRTDNILCYTSDHFARAVAPGVIARSNQGVVILDLDGDGNELTGWIILYLHIASQDRVTAGVWVQTGDIIGRPACEGGFSTATHMHIARRYNGEWLPADCLSCAPSLIIPTFTLSGWSVVSLKSQEYQGYLLKNGEQRTAEQGRLSPVNRVSW
jgi:LysM repeat protein